MRAADTAAGASVSHVAERATNTAPCPWGGTWQATLSRGARTVTGVITVLDSNGPVSYPHGYPGPTERQWHGRFAVAVESLFAVDEGAVTSTSVGRGTPEEIASGVNLYPVGDTVQVVLQPLVSHGPLSLGGVRHGDTITGRWWQRGGAVPSLHKPSAPPSPASFTLVRRAGCGRA
jgi:hypothetical protein